MLKAVLLVAGILVALAAALWVFGPREPVTGEIAFDPSRIGDDIDAYLYQRERDVPDLKRGAQKHVLWANPVSKERTSLSVVYIHGFSATLEEIRPVPDQVARTLGANLHYTRLTGHGRDGAAMADASVQAWREDMAEALEIGRRIGDRVLVIATSTGGSLATMAAFDQTMNDRIAGIVFVSPNFGLKAQGTTLLTMPFARQVVPMLLGDERGFAPENKRHGEWWTPRYPTSALVPMAAAMRAARAQPFEDAAIPAMFMFSDHDQIVDPVAIRDVAGRWGGAVSLWPVEPGLGDDHNAHVIAGDILSPGLTDAAVDQIVEWVRARGL